MTKILVLTLTVMSMLAGLALAGDVSGKWTAQVPGRNGQVRETTFEFKVEGTTLSGTVMGAQGRTTPISEGTVQGDEIKFVVKIERGGNTIEQKYTGKVSADELKMTRQGQRGEPVEFVAKRAK